MTRTLKTFLSLSVGTFLLLFLINIALPALFLLLRVQSFEIGSDLFWIMRWNNTASGSSIQFNLWLLTLISLLIGLVGVMIKRR